ncbi:oxidoreductase [Halobacteria archaeon AArc-dxtr1]|nr:oxidoreductase [Halobacteria archaeon AArc-dxtr1]
MGWTADDVPDLHGQTILVTGANSGIGREATRELARNGATVIMACRDVGRGEDAARDVREDVSGADLRVEECDLASLASVRDLATRLAEAGTELDCLVNNAGTMAIPRSETEDGFETQFGVNHLGHFALTGLVLELLTPDARVVTVSSAMHERGEIDFDDLHSRQQYDPWDAYAQSKLANVLFAYELERRFRTAGQDRLSVAVHPGYADTRLQFRGVDDRARLAALGRGVRWLANSLLAQSAERGALPTLYAATNADAEGGAYYGPDGLLSMRGQPERQASSDRSYDREAARRLWKISSEQTGVTYDLPRPAVEAA